MLAKANNDDDHITTVDERATEWTCDRLAEELLALDAENESSQLRELVLLAEDTAFTPEQSVGLSPRLLEIATRLRNSNDPLDESVVGSAIRTGASMLRPQEADRLLPLLEPGHPIETSRVALKMLGRIFEAQPPDVVDQYVRLADAVRGIAESLLNRYAIASSQSAAMAQLAVYALAAMASNDTIEVVGTVRDLEMPWFTQQTSRLLRELQEQWSGRSRPVAVGPCELLSRALGVLDNV